MKKAEVIKDLSFMTKDNKHFHSERLQIIRRSVWDKKDCMERRECLVKGPIHIVGPSKYPPYGIRNITDPRLRSLVNIDAPRQCIGKLKSFSKVTAC